jgi:hypothetical protein
MIDSSSFQLGFLVSDWGTNDAAYKAARAAFTGFHRALGEPVIESGQTHDHQWLSAQTLYLKHMTMPDAKDECWVVGCSAPDTSILSCIVPTGLGGIYTLGAPTDQAQ